MKQPIEDIWGKILDLLETSITRPSFENFRALSYPLSLSENELSLAVPNEFSKEWVSEKCGPIIKTFLHKTFGHNFSLNLEIIPEKESQIKNDNFDKKNASRQVEAPVYLNPKYIFENFVVGPSNQFAHAASLAVSEAPAKAYNPLFIYGGVGLGKSHLLQAIGHRVILKPKFSKVIYVSSEKFTNDFIISVKEGKMQEFRNHYRNADILLLDDIQFLGGKEQTQVEFFHTFNTLYEDSKQIVITSDQPPQEIANLDDRLCSRFEWGLITDIQPPELETRIAILKAKIEKDHLNIPDEVVYFIASQIPSNIRKLEGALISIVARSSLEKISLPSEISIEFAEKILKDYLSPKASKTITINLIKKTVADYYGIRIEDLSAKTRTQEIALTRQIAMYLARELTKISLPKIGENFGGRDHTTVLHAYDKIKKLIKKEPEMTETIKNLTQKVISG